MFFFNNKNSSIILLTPHIWKCDPHLIQTIIVDFVDAKELNVDALDVSVALLNSAQNYSIQLKASSLKTFEIARLDFNVYILIV